MLHSPKLFYRRICHTRKFYPSPNVKYLADLAPSRHRRSLSQTATTMGSTIEPYTIAVPDEALERLRAKLNLATLPGPTSFSDDPNYGAALTDITRLVTRWRDGYDWRKAEAELNKFPHFTTTITVDDHEDLKIHFIHQKSENPNSIPLLFSHGCKS